MKLFKLLLSVAGAAVLLGSLVSSASARFLSISNTNIRATFTRVDFEGGFGTTECRVTLEGSLHSRTIPKVRDTLIGFITSAIVESPRCIRGTATILTESLPWHVRYVGFTGALPAISTIITNVSGSRFQIREPFGITCLASGGIPSGTYTREAGGAISGVAITGTSPTNCGPEGTLRSTGGQLFLLGTTTRISIRLI
jgi:hypothetical protein